MKTLSLCGAFDLHIHAAPDCFDRIGNDIEIAQQAKAAGMRAIAIKSVYESTVSRAWHTMQSVEGLTVYGGVTMDHHVGGVNPAAVDPCLKMGGKIVWMPTYHAEGHRRAFGCIGGFSYAGQSNKVMPLTPPQNYRRRGRASLGDERNCPAVWGEQRDSWNRTYYSRRNISAGEIL